jgi:hypothetical protein
MAGPQPTPPGDPTRGLLPWGYSAALAACLLNGVWLACMIYLAGLGDVATQARTQPGIFRLSVGSAVLLTVMQVPILLATCALAAQRDRARALVGGVFYALYVPVNLIAYYSYGRVAPLVHAPPLAGRQGAEVLAGLVEIGHPLALTGHLPILGYGILGLAWCVLSTALWSRGRLWKVAVTFLFVSGLLSLLGAIGGFTDVPWLTHCCFLGGVVSLPALALLGIAIWREARRGRAAASEDIE